MRSTKVVTAAMTIGLAVLTALPSVAEAQTPEFRYWNGQAAQNWARSGVAASRGNVPRALYYQYRGARATGRAIYFNSRQWESIRPSVVNSPYFDSRRHYFRR